MAKKKDPNSTDYSESVVVQSGDLEKLRAALPQYDAEKAELVKGGYPEGTLPNEYNLGRVRSGAGPEVAEPVAAVEQPPRPVTSGNPVTNIAAQVLAPQSAQASASAPVASKGPQSTGIGFGFKPNPNAITAQELYGDANDRLIQGAQDALPLTKRAVDHFGGQVAESYNDPNFSGAAKAGAVTADALQTGIAAPAAFVADVLTGGAKLTKAGLDVVGQGLKPGVDAAGYLAGGVGDFIMGASGYAQANAQGMDAKEDVTSQPVGSATDENGNTTDAALHQDGFGRATLNDPRYPTKGKDAAGNPVDAAFRLDVDALPRPAAAPPVEAAPAPAAVAPVSAPAASNRESGEIEVIKGPGYGGGAITRQIYDLGTQTTRGAGATQQQRDLNMGINPETSAELSNDRIRARASAQVAQNSGRLVSQNVNGRIMNSLITMDANGNPNTIDLGENVIPLSERNFMATVSDTDGMTGDKTENVIIGDKGTGEILFDGRNPELADIADSFSQEEIIAIFGDFDSAFGHLDGATKQSTFAEIMKEAAARKNQRRQHIEEQIAPPSAQ